MRSAAFAPPARPPGTHADRPLPRVPPSVPGERGPADAGPESSGTIAIIFTLSLISIRLLMPLTRSVEHKQDEACGMPRPFDLAFSRRRHSALARRRLLLDRNPPDLADSAIVPTCRDDGWIGTGRLHLIRRRESAGRQAPAFGAEGQSEIRRTSGHMDGVISRGCGKVRQLVTGKMQAGRTG